MKVRVKIFGERNTGTNYLTKLISDNFDVEILKGAISKGSIFTFREWTKDLFFGLTKAKNLGWKHSKVDTEALKNTPHKIFVITLTKNPYSFLLSLYKRPYHYEGKKPTSFLSFLNTHWDLRKRDNIQGTQSLETPIQLWNIKNGSYIDFARNNENTLQIKYEDLLENPVKLIEQIATAINEPLKKEFTNYHASTKDDDKRFSDYQQYYLNEKWKDKISDKEVELINSKLDKKVVSYFGYELYLNEK